MIGSLYSATLGQAIPPAIGRYLLAATIYEENLFIEKAIESSKKISDKQFMREVIHNV